jgi:AraC-like DNA-binding protein
MRNSGSTQPRTVRLRRNDATVRIGGTADVPAVLRRLGADPARVLAEAGFDIKLFDDPDTLVSYAARNHMIAHCAARTSCPHFGLLVGQGGGLKSLGLVGLLVKYSLDAGAALRTLMRYTHLHVRGAVATLAVDGDSVTLGYEIYQSHVEATDQIGDAAVAVIFNIMRELCGPAWKPVQIRFAHRKPKDVGPFQQFFRAPLVFDATGNAIVFSADWLNRRLPAIDPDLRRLLQKQIDALENRHGEDFPGQVRSVLRTALVAGHGGVGQVADVFSIHRRTLCRRLNGFGTSFQTLADQCRFEIARQMLEHSAVAVREIAALLRYAAPGVFSRAFRRWSGTTPAEWRMARKGAGGGSGRAGHDRR